MGDGEMERVRRVVDEATLVHGIVLGAAVERWSVRGVPLSPFPARLRLDGDRHTLWVDVIAAEVVPPVAVEAVVEGIPLPRPEVRLMVGEARWLVAISYPLPFARITAHEVVGLLSAGALYATALVIDLEGHLGKRWRATLDGSGFTSRIGFEHDPRDLLHRGAVLPWLEVGQ